jgi:hypothetical protein
MRADALLGLSLALLTIAPPASRSETVTLEFDAAHSWGPENTGDAIVISRESDGLAVEINPANEKCWIDEDLDVGETLTLYISAENSTKLNKCEYKLLKILTGAAEFAEECGSEVVTPPHRC